VLGQETKGLQTAVTTGADDGNPLLDHAEVSGTDDRTGLYKGLKAERPTSQSFRRFR
jgi:hypothetical protein